MPSLPMDGEYNLFFLFLFPALLLLILKHLIWQNSSSPPLPPGPRPWPIIGNLLHMGKNPHVELANMACVHGPLISLRLGCQLLVVGSSPAAATEILKNQDRLFSARHIPKITPRREVNLSEVSLAWQSECGERWKFFRTLCRTHLFSTKALEAQSQIREQKVMEMVSFLETKDGEAVKVAEVVFATVFNMLGNIFFSKDFIDLENKQGDAGGLKGLIWRMMELGATPNIADFYPVLARFDLQGLNKKALKCVESVNAVWQVLVKERREGKHHGASGQHNFLDVLLDSKFDDDLINNLILELFTAGTDTSTSTVEWTMAELIKNPEAMYKVHEELEAEIKERVVREPDLPKLPYLQACIKETLRLHPPAPLLLPHRASETCEVMKYTIPKDSQVQVNLWAIGRDPTIWKDPMTFTPERFLHTDLDYKGNDFEFTPFGAGRRICPGLPMATRQVHLILASLINSFTWSLPHDQSPSQLDMSEKFGVTLQKEQPLLLVPKLKQ